MKAIISLVNILFVVFIFISGCREKEPEIKEKCKDEFGSYKAYRPGSPYYYFESVAKEDSVFIKKDVQILKADLDGFVIITHQIDKIRLIDSLVKKDRRLVWTPVANTYKLNNGDTITAEQINSFMYSLVAICKKDLVLADTNVRIINISYQRTGRISLNCDCGQDVFQYWRNSNRGILLGGPY